MKKYLLLIFYIIFFINGCHVQKNLNNHLINKKTNLIILDLDSTIEKIIINIIKLNNIFHYQNTLLFVDFPANYTNIYFDNITFVNSIKIKLNQTNKNINFLEQEIIEKSKKNLGISNINKNLDISLAMLLARNNHATYYLNSCIYGEKNPYSLKIELVLVKTGEILFTQLEKFYWNK